MATQFDAVARLSVDIKGFSSAARAMTQQGGQMQKVFQNLHSTLNQLEIVEKKQAAELRRTMGVYSAIATAATKYAQAVKALSQNSAGAATGVQNMVRAFQLLQANLSRITGLSEKEAARLQRTLSLYNQMASVLAKVNQATATAAKTMQTARAAEEASIRNQQRAAESAERLRIAQQRAQQQAVAAAQAQQLASERIAAANARAESAQLRLNQQLERQRTAAQQAAAAQGQLSTSLGNTSRMTLALRSDMSELEALYRSWIKLIGSAATSSVSAAISHEAAFAQVLRVTQETGEGAAQMRKEFEKLTTELPVGFEELSKIGQLAAQTGVANDQLVEFSRTVVQFSVTTGIASDQVTVLFARIAEMLDLPTNQMNNFASTILKLGTISAATEAEILKVNQSIASAGDVFGLSTEQIAGLSGALATLRIPPEWSRGSVTRIFRELDDAASDGGAGLQTLSEVMGMTTAEIQKLRATDPDTFFLKFVEGMKQFTREGRLAADSTRSITDVLSDLNVNAVRDVDFITRLANNFELLETQSHEAFLEFARGTELTKQTEVVFNTASQRIANMKDAFETFIAKVGEPFAKIIGEIAVAVTGLIELFQNASPATKEFISIFSSIAFAGGVVTLAILAWRLAMLKLVRGILAFRSVAGGASGSALGLANVMDLVRNRQEAAATAINQTATATTRAAAAATAAGRAQAAAAGPLVGPVRQSAQAYAAQAVALRGVQTQIQSVSALQGRLNTSSNQVATSTRAMNSALVFANQNMIRLAQATGGTVSVLNRSATATLGTARNGTALAATYRDMSGAVRTLNTQLPAYASAIRSTASQTQIATQANNQLRGTLVATGAAGGVAATGVGAAGAASTAAGVAARGAAAGFTFLRAALAATGFGLAVTAITGLVLALGRSKNEAKEAALAGYEAAGGMTALGDAIAKDTANARAGGSSLASYTFQIKDLTAADKTRLETLRANAAAEQDMISIIGGSIANLRLQAQGTGAAATQAQNYVKRWEAAQATLDRANQALSKNTIFLGENARALLEQSTQQALTKDAASKNVEAMKMLVQVGPQVQEALGSAFSDPQGAVSKLNTLIREADTEINAIRESLAGDNPLGADPETEKRLQQLSDYQSLLTTVRETISKTSGDVGAAAAANALFGKKTAEAAGSAKELGKGADEMANGMNEATDATQALTTSQAELNARTETLTNMFQSLGDFSSAMSAALEDARGAQEGQAAAQSAGVKSAQAMRDAQTQLSNSLKNAGADTEKTKKAYDTYGAKLKEIQGDSAKAASGTDNLRVSLDQFLGRLEQVAVARLQRMQNLIQLAARVPPDVMAELEKLGPEFSGVIQEMTTKSDAELQKLIPTFRGAGESASAAFGAGLAAITPVIAGQGADVANAASVAMNSAIQKALSSGGDVKKAIDLVVAAFTQVNKLKIAPQVAIDIAEAQGDLQKIEGIIRSAEQSGVLDAEGAAKLRTEVFASALEALKTRIKGTPLDAEGKANLNPEQFDRERERLLKDSALITLQNLIGVEGLATMDPKKYQEAIELLKNLGITTNSSGALDVEGTATLHDDEFWTGERNLRQLVEEGIRKSAYSPKGTADLQWGKFRTDLGAVEQAAWATGASISRALNRTATVNVGYYYYQKNSPPSVPDRMEIATGGWVRGPGGPRDDRIPAMLSNGEFVVNAAAASQFGSLLERINNRGFGRGGKTANILTGISSSAMTDLGSARQRGAMFESMAARRRQIYGQGDTAVTGMGSQGTVINVSNHYPQAEPTSVTINRSLAYAAMLDGTI